MIRVVGTIPSPVGEPIPYTSLLIQCIAGSTDVLLNSYVHIPLDETAAYDFTLLNATYRVYIKYANDRKVEVLGDCIVADGMPEEVTLNILMNNFTPVAPDWVADLDNRWTETWEDFVNDASTESTRIDLAITDGITQAVSNMATYTNEATQEMGAAITDLVAAGDAVVKNEAIAYTDALGSELSSNIVEVKNSVSSVSQSLEAYKTSSGTELSSIRNTVETAQASLSSEITAEVASQTGAAELRIGSVINSGNAAIGEAIGLTTSPEGKMQAAWQVAASVDELSSSVGMVNDGESSTVYLQAENIILTNSNKDITASSAPFLLRDGKVFINNAYIADLSAETITTGKLDSELVNTDTLLAKQAQSPDYYTGISGWSVNIDGTAEFNDAVFRGDIAGSNIDATSQISGASIIGSYVEGGIIYGAQIIVAGTTLAADADGDPSTPEYYVGYEGNSEYIVQCSETLSHSTGRKGAKENNSGNAVFYFPITCANDRQFPVTLNRIRTRYIPANVFSIVGYTATGSAAQSTGSGTQFEVLYEIVNRATGQTTLSKGWTGGYVLDDWNGTSNYFAHAFNGITFYWKFPIVPTNNGGDQSAYRTATMTHSAGNWGSTDPNTQGYLRISARVNDGLNYGSYYYMSGYFNIDNTALG